MRRTALSVWERDRRIDGVASMAWSLTPSRERDRRLDGVASMAWSLAPSTRAQKIAGSDTEQHSCGTRCSARSRRRRGCCGGGSRPRTCGTGAAGHQHCLVLRSLAGSIASVVKAPLQRRRLPQRPEPLAASLGVQRSSCECNKQSGKVGSELDSVAVQNQRPNDCYGAADQCKKTSELASADS